MNRSILIVICDFLLISLLAFSTVDEKTLSQPKADRRVKMEMNVNVPENRQDLAAVLKLALDDEQRTRDQLLRDLNKTREVVGRQQATLSERDEELAARNRQIQEAQQALQARDQEARRLAQEKGSLEDQSRRLAQEKGAADEQRNRLAQEKSALEQQARRLAQEKGTLEQQVAGAQSNLQNLQQQLSSTRAEALLSREQTEATREQLRQEQAKAAALQQQLGQLEQSNQVVQAERQQLAGRLQVAEVQRQAAADQAAHMQEQVKVEREEKTRLTQHADKLADGVKELAREVQENRPSAANTIFSEFVTNRVHARFLASRAGFLGLESTRRRETEVILATDGTNYCAVCPGEDAAVVPVNPAPDWETITGTLSRGTALLNVRSMSFSLLDPRVVMMPLTAAEVRELGCKVYRISKDPFKFQEAVLVGAREGYYGECKFELDLTTPQYLKMDRSVVRGIFGKFNPSRGDLVLSRTGELLGVMANNAYCLRLYNFASTATIPFGNTRDQHTGELLSRLQIGIDQMAFKLR